MIVFRFDNVSLPLIHLVADGIGIGCGFFCFFKIEQYLNSGNVNPLKTFIKEEKKFSKVELIRYSDQLDNEV